MRHRSVRFWLVIWGLIAFSNRDLQAGDSPRLIVHEWGTFTALENDNGEQLLGINVDTEPVPRFVHNLGRFLLNGAVLSSQHWIHRQKAVPRNHPQVSLRLETPVIYFYPPKTATLPMTVDVDVKFHGGWITEFYPPAEVHFPVVQDGKFQFTDLTPATEGHISWPKLQIGTDGKGPETNEHVWLAPRKTAAANLTSAKGEHEKYLFYRGVAHQSAPIRVITRQQGESLEIKPTPIEFADNTHPIVIQNLWLMETQANGKCAYRRLEPLTINSGVNSGNTVTTRRRFSDSEFDADNRMRLEAEMNNAILSEGLFADEAKALLSTWQQAYFTSPGLRVFYTVPRGWTDYYLPLTISGNPQVTRVMIGRVELISDTQRDLLDKLAKGPISKGDWLAKVRFDLPALGKLLAGYSDFGDLGVPIPADFQLYLDLSRFRNALIAAEEKRLNSANLRRFIQENQLEPFRLSQGSGK